MTGKPSSKLPKITNNRVAPGVQMEIHTPKDQPHQHLSGAYIRTLVKQLTSIKTVNGGGGDRQLPESPPPPPPPPIKKQVRRRRHTTKPYQQRLLNMAEARREIVSALKFHRKQREVVANTVVAISDPVSSDLSSNYPSVVAYHWPISNPPPLPPPPPPPLLDYHHENIDFILPNQTLGLNLNFQDFINMDANLYHNPLSNYSTSSSSSSSSSLTVSSFSAAVSETTAEEVTTPSSLTVVSETTAEEVTTAASQMLLEEVVATSSAGATTSSSSSSGAIIGGGLHHAMDDEGMEEIRSLGEQHQMEWNDTMNIMTSARWLKFLKNIEIEQGEGELDQVVGFPLCMDMEEIEGMDGEWFA